MLEKRLILGLLVELKTQLLDCKTRSGNLTYIGDAWILGGKYQRWWWHNFCELWGKNKFPKQAVKERRFLLDVMQTWIAPLTIGKEFLQLLQDRLLQEIIPTEAMRLARACQEKTKLKIFKYKLHH